MYGNIYVSEINSFTVGPSACCSESRRQKSVDERASRPDVLQPAAWLGQGCRSDQVECSQSLPPPAYYVLVRRIVSPL